MPTAQGSAGSSKLPLPIRHRPAGNASTTPSQSISRSTSQPPQSHGARQGGNDGSRPTSIQQPVSQARTPARNTFRASAPPTSAARYSIRTPGSQILPDFRASRQQHLASSVGRARGYAAPTQFTPHGRAAMRALDTRRAAIDQINTPGRNARRRRSGRDQRETPRDILRALSKTLAPKSKPVTTSTSSSSPDDGGLGSRSARRSRSRVAGGSSRRARTAQVVIPEDPDDDSDEFPIDRPRFSLPIDEDADSDGDLPRPPRSSGLEDLDDNFTMQSIELPRRATLGERQRLSMRMSDYGPFPGGDDDDGDVGIDSAFFPRADWADVEDDDTGNAGAGDDEATLERLDDEEAARRGTLGGRISDFGAIDFDLDAGDQSTVVLAPQVQSSPAREGFSPDNEPFGFDYGGGGDDDDEPPPLGDDDEELPAPAYDEMDVEDDTRRTGFNLEDDDDDDDDGGADVTDGRDQMTEMDITAPARHGQSSRSEAASARLKKPGKKISRYGVQYPSLPTSVVKRLAQRFAGKSKISPDTLVAIMQASDWFFEQLGDDLRAYANHAKGRTTINESDMITLMRRQRQTSTTATPFALAQKHLPRELLQELRMPVPAPLKKRRRRSGPTGDADEG